VFNAAGLANTRYLAGNGNNIIKIRIDNDPVSYFGAQLGKEYTILSDRFYGNAAKSPIWYEFKAKAYLELTSLYHAHTGTASPVEYIRNALTNTYIYGSN
jgi:hypothetical protein